MADQRRLHEVDPDEPVRRGDSVDIGNEFAFVRVAKVWTRNGERLEIDAPKAGYSIRLDAIELEALTRQPTEVFTSYLEDGFGSS
jgi:hypothetical protein